MKPSTPLPVAAYDIDQARASKDKFLYAGAPQWLKDAPLERLKPLHDALLANEQSLKAIDQATQGLLSPQQFAEQQFKPLVHKLLPQGPGLDALEWVDTHYVPGPLLTTPFLEPQYTHTAALLRLMQNFSEDNAIFATGLVTPAGEGRADSQKLPQILVSDAKVRVLCRELDAGKLYQDRLSSMFTPATQQLLAEHKRTAFALVCELALCQKKISQDEYQALSALFNSEGPKQQTLVAYAGELQMLQCTLGDALKIVLRDKVGELQAVIVYLPDDPLQSLHRFASLSDMDAYFRSELIKPAVQQRFRHWVRMRDRGTFSQTLQTRLQDDEPDLQLEGRTAEGSVFSAMAVTQVERLKDDGRLLLVPTADADDAASHRQLEMWSTIGLDVLGLAGLAIPLVGVALFGLLVVSTLKHVYEGVEDWSEGHQHEALQHLFSVVEAVAITALTAAGLTVAASYLKRSAFVDLLQPVTSDEGARLWQDDLQPYEAQPVQPQLQADGLYDEGSRRFLRVGQHYYELQQEAPGMAWRLRHAQRGEAYGPAVDFNGERSWRICVERPQAWDDSAEMLDRLWPMQPPLEADTAEQVLRVAGIDKEALRGLLVERRLAPVNLRDTLQRYTAAKRVSTVFEALETPGATVKDPQVLAWCRDQPYLLGLDDVVVAERLLEKRAELRPALLEYLARATPAQDDAEANAQGGLLERLRSSLPGLPPAYAAEALLQADPRFGEVEQAEGRVPLALLTSARPLLAQARLTRALEGLLLETDYSDGTGELVMALLPRLAHWPKALNLELLDGSVYGRRIGILDPQGAPQALIKLVSRQGVFRLYDSKGMELEAEVEAPGGLFQAIMALLDDAARQKMGLTDSDPAAQLRLAVIKQLPQKRSDILKRLGWREHAPAFVPGKHLPDGRFGYLLGGRQSRNRTILDALGERIAGLYPSLDDTEVQAMIEQWRRDGRDPLEEILAQETQYASLDDALARWEREASGRALRSRRRQCANSVRAAWRYEGQGVIGADGTLGRVLTLDGWRVGRLPRLRDYADFSHILELRMSGMDLEEIPIDFLRRFEALQTLKLSNNLLIAVPEEIARLPNLTTLQMRSNLIQLDAAGIARLSGLDRLRTLVLDHNPLGTLDLDFARLTELRVLRASRCGLQSVPDGLERCPHLADVDLRFNRITSIPRRLLDMPRVFRRGVSLDGNPIAGEDLSAFGVHEARLPTASVAPDLDETLIQWLTTGSQDARKSRETLWGRIKGLSGSADLMDLLGRLTQTQDFDKAPEYVGGQVWQMLEQIDKDPVLRDDLFAHAGLQLTCHDSVAERFSRLWLRALVHAAEKQAATGRGGDQLFMLARSLFRMDRLDDFARAEVVRRELGEQVVDELEVVLGFRVNLATRLDLVGQPRNMQFGAIAEITKAQEDQAYEAVINDESGTLLAESLSTREFWCNYLKNRHPQLFASQLKSFERRASLLEGRKDAEGMSDDAYVTAYDTLKRERDLAEQRMLLLLSQDAVEQVAAGNRLDPEEPETDESDEADGIAPHG